MCWPCQPVCCQLDSAQAQGHILVIGFYLVWIGTLISLLLAAEIIVVTLMTLAVG